MEADHIDEERAVLGEQERSSRNPRCDWRSRDEDSRPGSGDGRHHFADRRRDDRDSPQKFREFGEAKAPYNDVARAEALPMAPDLTLSSEPTSAVEPGRAGDVLAGLKLAREGWHGVPIISRRIIGRGPERRSERYTTATRPSD